MLTNQLEIYQVNSVCLVLKEKEMKIGNNRILKTRDIRGVQTCIHIL